MRWLAIVVVLCVLFLFWERPAIVKTECVQIVDASNAVGGYACYDK